MSDISKCFEAAREFIEERKCSFICVALRAQTLPRHEEAIQIVSSRLEGFSTYIGWVLCKHPEVYDETPPEQRDHAARQGRLAWLESLIEEFK